MKQLFVFFAVTITALFCSGQNPPTNFFEFIDQYYRSNPQDDGEAGEKESINRNSFIWSERLFPHGNFNIAANAIFNYTKNFNDNAQNKNLLSNTPNWTLIGPFSTPVNISSSGGEGTGQIHVIAFDPNYNLTINGTVNKTVYAGSSFGGLFRSTDDGQNWSVLNTDNQLPVASVSDIAIDKANTNNIFISTGHRDNATFPGYNPNWANINPIFTVGIYRSTDGGLNWTAINNGLLNYFSNGGAIRRIIIHPTDSNILFAATSEGIFKTTNALSANPTWQLIYTPTIIISQNDFPDYEIRGMEFKPDNPNIIYASGSDIYRTTNGGNSWNKMTGTDTGLDFSTLTGFTVERINITVTPANNNRLYAYIIGKLNGIRDFYIYMYDGTIWSQKFTSIENDIIPYDDYHAKNPGMIAIAVSPVNANEVYFGFTKTYGTNDISVTTPVFTVRSPYNGGNYHADVHALAFQPNVNSNPNLFCGNDGGVSIKDITNTSTGGWSRRNNGLAVATIWTFDDNEYDKDVLITGNQDVGVNITRKVDNNIEWAYIDGGDGYGAQIGNDAQHYGYYISNTSCKMYDFLTNTYTYEFKIEQGLPGRRPIDPASSSRSWLPKTFQIINHPQTGEMYWTFTEIFKRFRDNSDPTDETTPENLWELESDIGKVEPDQWKRQITELAISESNPDYIYLATGGVDNGMYGPSWQLSPRLFKSTSGGNQGNYILNKFSDITSNLPSAIMGNISPYVITGIAIHPTNPNKIWVSFSGYDSNYKVLFSTNGGYTWDNADPNISLANLPVNGIVYQDGTDDLLYIATDRGVFFKDNLMSSWEKYGDIPNVRVVELKINYCANKLRAATFGRGVWEADLMPFNNFSNDLVISTNTTWATNKSINKNLRILAGKTLTILSTCSMPIKSKIIVEIGATLIVDGGKITNNCGNMWQGIEVWGNSSSNQFTSSNQGVVELINGATIENAVQAIRTIQTNPDNTVNLAYTGGIVKANGAKFINCINGIRFERYHNVYNGTTYNNKSYVHNCSFETNDLALSAAQIPGNYIYLQNVEGISFKGNTFRNLNTAIIDPDSRGFGIRSINARYSVTNNTTTYPCVFEGLNYGIYASNTNALIPLTVTSCSFDMNYTGIGLKGINNAWITSNTFSSAGSAVPVPRGVGLYLDNCNGYKVEDNGFNGSNGGYYGILLHNYGVINNTIYKNYYVDLDVSIQAGNNPLSSAKSLNPPPSPVLFVSGLRIKCNLFTAGGTADIALTSGHLGNPQGTCGSMSSTANNSFSTGSTKSIWVNPGLLPVDYFYYPGGNNAPHNYNTSLVIPHQCTATNGTYIYAQGCSSTLGGSGTSSGTLLAGISTSNLQLQTLNSKIDGGNTQNLLNKINSNIAPGTLKNFLLAVGPYLSDTVLIATIKKTNPLPSGILKNIIIPNSPVTNRVAAALNTITLPAGIKQEIQTAQTGTSARAILEQQIVDLQQLKDASTAELMRYYLNDSIVKIDSAILFLATQTDLISRQQLALAYLLSGNCANASSTINSLQAQNSEPQATNDLNAFKHFYSILATLCTEGNTLFNLTTAQMQEIITLSTSGTSVSASAQAVLTLVNGTIFPEIIEELIVPDDQTLRGFLFNNPSCNNSVTEPVEVPNDTIILLDSALQVAEPLIQAITDNQGYFKFNFNDLIYLDSRAKYTFGTASGAVIQDTIFKTIQQWITASPVNLNLKKLKAGFVNDTVKCFIDTVHFTNKTMYGKKPYTYNWSFAFHSGSSLANPVHKYSSAGIYNTSLIVTDALGCKDTAIKQIIIPACPSIFGTIVESVECGSMPIINDTIFITDYFDNIYDTIFASVNNTGQFAFDESLINKLDTSFNYGFKLKSGFGFEQLQYNSIRNWKTMSPLSLITDHREYWSRDFSMSDSAKCFSTSIDINRNIYVAGTAYYPYLKTDYMLIKYNPVGDELWHISFNPTGFGNYNLTDMKNDNSGNCILTGSGDEGPTTVEINPEGIIEWSNTWTDDNYFGEDGYLAIDTLNNIYLASNISDGSGSNNFALTKYSNSGQKLWSTIYNTISMFVQKITLDKAGNIIILCSGQNTHNSYIFKYNSYGTLIWSAYNTNNLLNIAVGNDNSVYATGNTVSTPVDFFTVKYDVNGNYQWSQTYSYSLLSGNNIANQITIDKDGNIIVAGISPYTAVNGPNNTVLTRNCYTLVKYAPDGTVLWDAIFAIEHRLYSSWDYIASIITDKLGNIYTAGSEKIYPYIPRVGFGKPYSQFLTTKFNSNGDIVWNESPYTTKYNSSYLSDFIVSDNENVYVTGTTFLNGVRTIKYVQCPSQSNNARYGNSASNGSGTNETSDNQLSYVVSYPSSTEYVNMFPNPNDGNFYFNYSLPENEKCQFTAFDPTGKKVYSIEIKGGKNTVMVNHNNFSNGVYYYQVTVGKRLIKTERLVITK